MNIQLPHAASLIGKLIRRLLVYRRIHHNCVGISTPSIQQLRVRENRTADGGLLANTNDPNARNAPRLANICYPDRAHTPLCLSTNRIHSRHTIIPLPDIIPPCVPHPPRHRAPRLRYLFNGNEASGYSLVQATCLDDYTHTHLFGHNLGCNHNREDTIRDHEYAHGLRYCDGEDP